MNYCCQSTAAATEANLPVGAFNWSPFWLFWMVAVVMLMVVVLVVVLHGGGGVVVVGGGGGSVACVVVSVVMFMVVVVAGGWGWKTCGRRWVQSPLAFAVHEGLSGKAATSFFSRNPESHGIRSGKSPQW